MMNFRRKLQMCIDSKSKNIRHNNYCTFKPGLAIYSKGWNIPRNIRKHTVREETPFFHQSRRKWKKLIFKFKNKSGCRIFAK